MDWSPEDIAIALFSVPKVEGYESYLPAAVVLEVECALQLFDCDDEERGFWHLTFARTAIDWMEPEKREHG